MCRRRTPTPPSVERALQRGDRLGGPDTTQTAGRVDRRERQPAPSRGAARSSGSGTASIAPPGASRISRPRSATSASASSSDSTPARHAATYSPMLWPSIAAGARPTASRAAPARTRRRRAPAGRSTVCAQPRAVGLGRPRRAGRAPRAGRARGAAASASAQRVDLAAEHRLARVEPAAHADVLRRPGRGTGTRPGGRARLPAAGEHAPRIAPRETTATASSTPRHDQRAPVRERPRGRAGACRRRRPGSQLGMLAQVRRPGAPSRPRAPSRVRAESTSSCAGRDGAVAALGAGASSRTTCAFVPPMPKRADAGPPRRRRRAATARARC